MKRTKPDLTVVGGGLAGSEAAWQAAERGLYVHLYEMRPFVETGAHESHYLAELVCSNSLGSNLGDRASGLLKNELRKLGSLLIRCADETSLPAGGALAVDRNLFAQMVTEFIKNHPNIEIVRKECLEIPDGLTIISTGPLTSATFSESLAQLTGKDHLYFFDAIAPIVTYESVNMDVAYRASRYGRGEQAEGDYINCPFTEGEYQRFVHELVTAERIELKEFELEIEKGVAAGAHKFFEGCLPIEIMANSGENSLAYGPMRPVGLDDPRTGCWPYAVVQLRQDDQAGSLYNLVGFQTNLKYSEQKRVLRLIPGLENAEFARFGQMHRNTFIYSPAHLKATLQFKERENLLFAGQITGVEGYVGNIATGLLAGWNSARIYWGKDPLELPPTTMLGALCHYIVYATPADFQPMKANFGILAALEMPGKKIRGKRNRAAAYVSRAEQDLENFIVDIMDERKK